MKIIFVHGMNADRESWNGLQDDPKIKAHGETEAITLPGHDELVFTGTPPNPKIIFGMRRVFIRADPTRNVNCRHGSLYRFCCKSVS